MKTADRLRLLLTATFLCGSAGADLFNFKSFDRHSSPSVTATARQEPSAAVIGQPCAILLEMEIDREDGIENLQVGGLPDTDGGSVMYGDGFETLADEPSAKKDRIIKRFRLPVRFLTPQTNACTLTLHGMAVTRRQRGSMSFSSSQSFRTRTRPFRFNVVPLPDEGRPATFSGAVGTRFTLRQSLSPARVHPGDLVTATYTLTFDGHCPSNALPRLTDLPAAFKAYELKEKERTSDRIVWTQMLVPRTTQAVRSAHLALDYYDIAAKRYRTCEAKPFQLVFVSEEAASTENTAVVVNTDEAANVPTPAPEGAVPVTLRFAPSEVSPVLAVLPPGTPVTERARTKTGWRRLETPHATGWSRP